MSRGTMKCIHTSLYYRAIWHLQPLDHLYLTLSHFDQWHCSQWFSNFSHVLPTDVNPLLSIPVPFYSHICNPWLSCLKLQPLVHSSSHCPFRLFFTFVRLDHLSDHALKSQWFLSGLDNVWWLTEWQSLGRSVIEGCTADYNEWSDDLLGSGYVYETQRLCGYAVIGETKGVLS